MIERISTDLPVPDPPTTPRISPRQTVEVEILVDDLLAEAIAQAADRDDRLGFGLRPAPSDRAEEDGEDGVEHDHEEDRLDDRGGRAQADFFRIALDQHALEAARQRDDEAEDRRLDQRRSTSR